MVSHIVKDTFPLKLSYIFSLNFVGAKGSYTCCNKHSFAFISCFISCHFKRKLSLLRYLYHLFSQFHCWVILHCLLYQVVNQFFLCYLIKARHIVNEFVRVKECYLSSQLLSSLYEKYI